ncbi:serine/threonine-protein kinase MARK2-like [Saccopteryx leptura]|uniref:serine/threonine-protein kinase MARK2-like n=1 Tax=Saccopteryx leptura TaxID=249018 RepID=UPI00339CEF8F
MSGYFDITSKWKLGTVGNYMFIRTLGTGGFATVKLARHVPTGMLVAVKILSIKSFNPKVFREVELLKSLNHPNVVKLVEVIVTDSTLFIVMEYVSGGDLSNYLPSNRPSTESEARHIFRQLISAVQYCHWVGIVHRDLKLENVLVDAHRNIKVTDFGLGRKVEKDELKTYCGTEWFMAPEMLQCRTYEGRKVDIWGLGVILFQMVTGELPFKDRDLTKVKKKIMAGKFTIPGFLSVECQALLKKLMALNPSERSAAEEILKDPWVNNGQKEHLKPYGDVPRGNLDPEIVEQMIRMGFQHRDIEKALSEQSYNHIMGTYLLVEARNYQRKSYTVLIRPCPQTHDIILYSSQASVAEVSVSTLGGGMSNPECRARAPPPGPASRAIASPPGPASQARAPPSGSASCDIIPPPSPVSQAIAPAPCPASWASTPPPGLASRASSPPPSPASQAIAPPSGPASWDITPPPSPVSQASSPPSGPASRASSPPSDPASWDIIPRPSPVTQASSPPSGTASRASSPPPSPASQAIGPPSSPASRDITPPPSPVSQASSPPSCPASHTSSPPPGPASQASAPLSGPASWDITPPPSPVSQASSPPSGPASRASSPPSGPTSRASSPPPGPASQASTPPPGPASRTSSPPSSPASWDMTPRPSPVIQASSPPSGPASWASSLPPGLAYWDITPTASPVSQASALPSGPASRAIALTSGHEARARVPTSSQEAMIAACSPAFQPDPVSSPTTPSSNNTSCGSRTQEGNTRLSDVQDSKMVKKYTGVQAATSQDQSGL